MRAYRFERLTDRELLRTLTESVARERAGTVEVVALIAEVDARRLYLPAGHSSMFAYCVEKLRLSENSAYKRIRVARTARRFPTIFAALADGRLNLSGVVLLAPYLTPENAGALLKAAEHRAKSEIEELLALRFPRSEMVPLVQALPHPASRSNGRLTLEPDDGCAGNSPAFAADGAAQLAPGPVEVDSAEPVCAPGDLHAAGRVPAHRPKLAPVAPGRFVLQLTIDEETHDMLRHAQALVGHSVPSGDLAEVLKRSLSAFVQQLEKRKFAATSKPRPGVQRRSSGSRRHVPAHVKRAVWQRDGARCTFVGENGHRCTARRLLEFDHVEPVARGGQATVDGVRLRCRAHNQLEAERVFGVGFMREKRQAHKRAAADRRAAAHQGVAAGPGVATNQRAAAACPRAPAAGSPARGAGTEPLALPDVGDQATDVMSALRGLGFRVHDARRAEAFCAAIPDATLEERVRAALRFLCPGPRVRGREVANPRASA